MRLIGMLDSPYVRRVAVSMALMRLPFEHEPLSLFRDFDEFASASPTVKAPTLVTNDGTILVDSTLIIAWLETRVPAALRLTPEEPERFLLSQRLIGLALVANEKSVQIVYERNLRPAEKQHQPWLDRVLLQLLAAYDGLEAGYAGTDAWLLGGRPTQVDVTAATAWRFTRSVIPELVPERRYPALCALSERAEAMPEFLANPIEGPARG